MSRSITTRLRARLHQLLGPLGYHPVGDLLWREAGPVSGGFRLERNHVGDVSFHFCIQLAELRRDRDPVDSQQSHLDVDLGFYRSRSDVAAWLDQDDHAFREGLKPLIATAEDVLSTCTSIEAIRAYLHQPKGRYAVLFPPLDAALGPKTWHTDWTFGEAMTTEEALEWLDGPIA